MQQIAKLYQAANPSHKVEFMSQSMPTGATIEATKVGRIGIGLVGEAPRDSKMVYRALGRVPVAIAVNKNTGVTNLSESQVCDIMSGKIKTWGEVGGKGEKITVLTIIDKNDIYKDIVNKELPCYKGLKISSDAITLGRAREVRDAVNSRPGTIGWYSLSAAVAVEDPNVKPVSLNGVVPNKESIQKGTYKLYSERGVITLGEPSGLAKHFLEFVSGPEGSKVLVAGGIVPVR
jgi:phosphate transport system substrate-binding protein